MGKLSSEGASVPVTQMGGGRARMQPRPVGHCDEAPASASSLDAVILSGEDQSRDVRGTAQADRAAKSKVEKLGRDASYF